MKLNSNILSGDAVTDSAVSGIWKVQSEQKSGAFEALMLQSMEQSKKVAQSGFYPIHPNLSADTVSRMVKGFADASNTVQKGKVVSAALSSEQNMILNESASSLYTREFFSRLTAQLQSTAKSNLTEI